MRIHRIVTPTFGCVVLFTARHAVAGDQCPTVTESERTRLIAYVQAKYRLPTTSALKLSELSLVEKTCYRKLRFAGADPKRPFQIDLIASPGLRFLTRELTGYPRRPGRGRASKAAGAESRVDGWRLCGSW